MIQSLDHLVLTVRNLERTLSFYGNVLGMKALQFGEGRWALAFGEQKINLHLAGSEYLPKAAVPTPGSADLCFLVRVPLSDVVQRLQEHRILIEEGPVRRTGATGPLLSVYVRDPDANLIELSVCDEVAS